MKILVTGGTGFVGAALVEYFNGLGHEMTVLTRSISKAEGEWHGVNLVEGDPTEPGPWQEAVVQADAIINLAGANIFQRWTDAAKDRIMESRVSCTRNILAAAKLDPRPGRVLLSASAVGYYGPQCEYEVDESYAPGDDFLAEVSTAWEKEALEGEKAGMRVCLMRFGIVLESDGGALGMMKLPFKMGLGGKIGSGEQWMSWIHRLDLIRAAEFLLEHAEASGPFNFTAPEPVRNEKFAKTLGKVLSRPAIIPVPGLAMKLALGEFGDVLLNGAKVLPKKLTEMGFEFMYPTLKEALRAAME